MANTKKISKTIMENPALLAMATRLAPTIAASAAGSAIGKKLGESDEDAEIKEEIKDDKKKAGASAFDMFEKHFNEGNKEKLEEGPFDQGASKVIGPLMNAVTKLDPATLMQFVQMVQKLVQMKQSMGGSISGESKKLVKEAVPPGKKETMLKQQIQDIMKYFQEEPTLATQVLNQLKMRKPKVVQPPIPQQAAFKRPPVDISQKVSDYPQGKEISDDELADLGSKFESKISLTKEQLKEVVSKAIEIKSQKNIIKETMIHEVREQIKVRALTESLLTEGPFSNVFRGIKGAVQGAGQQVGAAAKSVGQAAGTAVKNVGQAAKAKAAQAVQQGQAADQAKEIKTNLSNTFKSAMKAKEKFSQEKLKNTGLINQYHDSVVALNNALDQAKGVLSQPEVETMGQQVQSTIENLYYDLTSEKDGIDVFLKTLRSSVPGLSGKQAGANAVKSAKKSANDGEGGRGEIKGGFGRPSLRGTRR